MFASGCAGGKATTAPPPLSTTDGAVAYAESIDDADLVVHVEVRTRLNRNLPHHMAHAQLAFINKTSREIKVPKLDADALLIEGDQGRVPCKPEMNPTRDAASDSGVMLAPGQMIVSHVDLLKIYDFPADGGRFTVRFAESSGLPAALQLHANADYFVVGPR